MSGSGGAPPSKKRADKTEQRLARQFAAEYADRLRFDHGRGRWLLWDKHHWKADGKQQAFGFALDFCLAQGFARAEKIRFASAIERAAKALAPLNVSADAWNRDPNLLACPDGVIELETGAIRPGRQEDLIDRCLGVTPVSQADYTPPKQWFAFLDMMFSGDGEVIDFVLRWFGYCLSGDTSEQRFVFLHGTGGNGKGTLIRAIQGVMGGYAANASIDTFLESPGDRHPTELARLHGPHLVVAPETKQGRHWDEAKIKTVTGGDTVTARFMHKDEFEYRPRFKLTFHGNHKPFLHSVDDAIRRRIVLIPCRVSIPKDQQDLDLEHKLAPEYPQILALLMEHYRHWRQHQLRVPAVLSDATDDYLEEMDDYKQWLDEVVQRVASTSDTLAGVALFDNWFKWKKRRNEEPGSARTFYANLEQRGLRRKLKTNSVTFECIRFKPFAGQAQKTYQGTC